MRGCEGGHGSAVPLHQRGKHRAPRWMRRLWRGVREWCGDASYERYLRAKARQGCGHHPMSAEQFYIEQLERKYSRPNRCC